MSDPTRAATTGGPATERLASTVIESSASGVADPGAGTDADDDRAELITFIEFEWDTSMGVQPVLFLERTLLH